MNGYKVLESHKIKDIQDGEEVIVEQKHFEYKRGYPLKSTFYRAIVGHHMTCAGIMADLESEPDFNFPEIPPWQGKIYAENSGVIQLWVRGEEC